MTKISWEAPFYISTIQKNFKIIFILLLFGVVTTLMKPNYGVFYIILASIALKIFLKKSDPYAQYIQLWYEKMDAKYSIETSSLIIEYNKTRKVLMKNNILSFSRIAPELYKFYSAPEYSILYFKQKGAIFTKYIPVFTTAERDQEIFENLSKIFTYTTNEEVAKKEEPKFLKYFGYTIVALILLLGIILTINQIQTIIK